MKHIESREQIRRYTLLRARMHEYGLRVSDLARATGVSLSYLNNVFGGRGYPKIDICYDILKRLDLPPAELPYYFPPGGITLERETPRAVNTFPRQIVLHMNGEIRLTAEDNEK